MIDFYSLLIEIRNLLRNETEQLKLCSPLNKVIEPNSDPE